MTSDQFRAKLQLECDLFAMKYGQHPTTIVVSQSAHDLLTKHGQMSAQYFGQAQVMLGMPEPTPSAALWLGSICSYHVWQHQPLQP